MSAYKKGAVGGIRQPVAKNGLRKGVGISIAVPVAFLTTTIYHGWISPINDLFLTLSNLTDSIF